MSSLKTLAAAAALAATLLAPSIGHAQTTLDFESTGAGSYGFIGSYGGFTWNNMLLLPPGYGANVSGSYAAYTHCCTSGASEITRATPFLFLGASMTNYWGYGDRIVGYLAGAQVFDQAITNTSSPLFNDFSGTGAVDQLVFTTSTGGTSYIGNVFVDDFQYAEVPPVTATPEPASVALMATGLVGIAAAARRRRAARA